MFYIVALVFLLGNSAGSLVSKNGYPSLQLCEATIEKDRPGVVEDVVQFFVERGEKAEDVRVDMKCEFRDK